MVFSSSVFLFLFLPCILIGYTCVPRGFWQNLVLLLGSLFFYAWGEPVYVVLLVISCISNYFHGLRIQEHRDSERSRAAWWLFSGIAVNLLLLFYFKYADLFLRTVNFCLGTSFPMLHIPLPVGLSFFSFQTISYLIDVYLRRITAERNIITMSMYVSMFSQLVAGPIVRYCEIRTEIARRERSLELFASGVNRFVIGLAKKVLLANTLGELSAVLLAEDFSHVTVASSWLAVVLYAFQIYFDFSGYSDMAIGLSRMFGFRCFPENFNYPYTARSIREFWHRWHMTLSNFFRDYMYIPLGGSRVSAVRWVFNVLVVWGLIGLWHGASFNFVVWGLYFGVILVVERFLLKKFLQNERLKSLQHAYTIFLFVVGWAIFAIDDGSQLIAHLANMFWLTDIPLQDYYIREMIFRYFPILCIAAVGVTPLMKQWVTTLQRFRAVRNISAIGVPLLLFITISFMVTQTFNPFIYFRF